MIRWDKARGILPVPSGKRLLSGSDFMDRYILPDKVFGLRYQSPPFDNVLTVRLTQGGSF